MPRAIVDLLQGEDGAKALHSLLGTPSASRPNKGVLNLGPPPCMEASAFMAGACVGEAIGASSNMVSG